MSYKTLCQDYCVVRCILRNVIVYPYVETKKHWMSGSVNCLRGTSHRGCRNFPTWVARKERALPSAAKVVSNEQTRANEVRRTLIVWTVVYVAAIIPKTIRAMSAIFCLRV